MSATEFQLRSIALVAFGPSVVTSIGHGAVLPVLALRARELGADVSTAAVIVALLGLGMLVSSLPAGALVARIGERRALAAIGYVDAAAMIAGALAASVTALGVAVLVNGACWTVFLMARQGYLIDAVPDAWRARAMSMLGGTSRVGVLIGPLLGAALIHFTALSSVFWMAAVTSVAAALWALRIPDLGGASRAAAKTSGRTTLWTVLVTHRRTLLTLGIAVVVLGASRSLRTSLLPLWADHVGLSASSTSLIFAVAAAVDLMFIWPGGRLMDTHGRAVVAAAVVLSMALACLLLPLANSAWSVTAVMVLIAGGNGLGSGIVMTLGADTAPAQGRALYLGAWRLCGDIGNTGGPWLVGAAAAIAPLAAACVIVGVVTLLGSGWVIWWTHRLDVFRRASIGTD